MLKSKRSVEAKVFVHKADLMDRSSCKTFLSSLGYIGIRKSLTVCGPALYKWWTLEFLVHLLKVLP